MISFRFAIQFLLEILPHTSIFVWDCSYSDALTGHRFSKVYTLYDKASGSDKPTKLFHYIVVDNFHYDRQ